MVEFLFEIWTASVNLAYDRRPRSLGNGGHKDIEDEELNIENTVYIE